MVLFGIGKLTGLVRARLVSNSFGTGSAFDAFTAANQLPEVFFVVISGGSLAAAFIPVYTAYLAQEGPRRSARLANTVLTIVFGLLAVIAALGALLAPWLTRVLLVPDFPPQSQQLTADLMRILLITAMLYGISGVLSSILNAHQHFALPALSDITIDIGYLTGIFLFASAGIYGLAWGTVVGAALQILVQIPGLLRFGYRFRPRLDLKLSGVRQIAHLMGPRIVTLGVIQVADLFIVRLASALPAGSTAGYFYAYQLMQLPETLFGTAIALVVFPTLAELYNAGDLAGLKHTFARAMSVIWALTVPAAAAVALLGRQAIATLLETGAFTAESTALVYRVLLVFCVRIVSEATLDLVARLFYAQHNTRTPMFTYLGWLVINVGLAFWLVDDFDIAGLALASTVAFTVLAAALLVLNRRALGGLEEGLLARNAARTLAATAGMAVVIWLVGQWVPGTAAQLLVGIGSGLVTYVLLHLLLGGQEIPALLRMLRERSS